MYTRSRELPPCGQTHSFLHGTTNPYADVRVGPDEHKRGSVTLLEHMEDIICIDWLLSR
jgi:hypothetical protein